MIRSVLKRRGLACSSFVRLFSESGTRSLRTEATGMTSNPFSCTRESLLSRLGCLRSFSGVSYKQKSSSGSSSDSSESDLEEVLPLHADTAMLLRSLNAHQFQKQLKELEDSDKHITYKELLKLAKDKGAAATLAQSRQLCDAMIASGTIFRYGNRVYLDPDEIADLARSVLPGTREETEALIEKLEKEMEPIRIKQEEIENKSSTISNWALRVGLLLALGAFGFMYRMTYTTYSWDVMEPVAYFIALGAAIFCYGYFVFARKDFQFSELPTHVNKYYRRRSNITDCSKYETLKKQIAAHRAFLSRIKR